jgi:hypothetical protein
MEPNLTGTAILRLFAATAAAIMVTAMFSSSPAHAQWLKFKTPGIPRTPDGKPNLSAPAPRAPNGKPDLSGLWRTDPAGTAETGKAEDAVKALPWADALTQKRKETIGKDSPSVLCLPPGPVVDMGVGRIVQSPNILVMLWGGTLYREIFMDGRELPKDPNPDWMGYSVGHWEGDTLVIESIGFNDRTWLDDDGHPHTEALHVTERIHRSDYGHMEIIRTLVDPGALAEPWTVPVKLELYADTEPLEYVCNENERDRDHLVGKTTDEKGIDVAAAILQKYVGNYELTFPATGQVFTLAVSLKDNRLVLGGMGPSEPLLGVSQTEFTGTSGTTFNFVMNEAGTVTQMNIHAVEGDFKAVRK